MPKTSSQAFHVLLDRALLPESAFVRSAQGQRTPKWTIQATCSQLNRLLARATAPVYCSSGDVNPLEAWLANLVQQTLQSAMQGGAESYPAWAMMGPDAEDEQTDLAWRMFLGTPGHLSIERDGVQFVPAGALDSEESDTLAFWAVVRPLLEAEGWNIIRDASSQHVLLKSPEAIEAEMPSPMSLQHLRLTDYLPRHASAAAWRKLWMRIQVELHQAPFNQNRESRGLQPLNALWLWGSGNRPTVAARPKFFLLGEHGAPTAQALQFWESVFQALGFSASESIESCSVYAPHFEHWQLPSKGLNALEAQYLAPAAAHGMRIAWHFLGDAGWKTIESNWKTRALFWKTKPDWSHLIEPEPEGAVSAADLESAWQAGHEQQQQLNQEWLGADVSPREPFPGRPK